MIPGVANGVGVSGGSGKIRLGLKAATLGVTGVAPDAPKSMGQASPPPVPTEGGESEAWRLFGFVAVFLLGPL